MAFTSCSQSNEHPQTRERPEAQGRGLSVRRFHWGKPHWWLRASGRAVEAPLTSLVQPSLLNDRDLTHVAVTTGHREKLLPARWATGGLATCRGEGNSCHPENIGGYPEALLPTQHCRANSASERCEMFYEATIDTSLAPHPQGLDPSSALAGGEKERIEGHRASTGSP